LLAGDSGADWLASSTLAQSSLTCINPSATSSLRFPTQHPARHGGHGMGCSLEPFQLIETLRRLLRWSFSAAIMLPLIPCTER
jgi:hypothetical protein